MIPKTIELFFAELVLKIHPGWENGAQIGEIEDYVFPTLQIVKKESRLLLDQGSPGFSWIYSSDCPCNHYKRILQRCAVLTNLHNAGILDTEKSPDTIPGIHPELLKDHT